MKIKSVFAMGFFLTDYLKCDLAEFNFRMLTLCGFWPLTTTKKWIQKIHIIYYYASIMSTTFTSFVLILDIYLLRDLKAIVKNLAMSSIAVMNMRYYFFLHNKEKIRALHVNLDDHMEYKRNSENVDVFRERRRQMAWTMKSFGFMVFICTSLWMIIPAIEKDRERPFPFPFRLPIDIHVSPIFEIVYAFEVLLMIGYSSMILFTDLILLSYIIRINCLYSILIKDIRKIGISKMVEVFDDAHDGSVISEADKETIDLKNPKIEKMIRNDLKKCVQYYQIIRRKIDGLQQIFTLPSMIFFAAVILTLGVLIIDVCMISKGLRWQTLQKMFYCVCFVFDSFLWCLLASVLEDKNEQIWQAFYEIPWYEFRPKLRKDLVCILMASNKPVQLKIGNLISSNFSRLLDVLKITYNVILLLYNTITQ